MQNTIVIHTPSQTVSFQTTEVLYLEIYDKLLHIHKSNGDVLTVKSSLSSLLAKLPETEFVQCHRSFIVALFAVRSITRYEIALKNHEKIPVSKQRYKNVQNALICWAESATS